MSWADRISSEDVVDWKSFADYAQQEAGIPRPTQKQIAQLRAAANQFFEEYPHTSWGTLAKIVDWAKARRQRYATPSNLIRGGFRFAWQDGYLPELDPDYADVDPDLAIDIERALEVETDPAWRRRLIVANGRGQREETYREWSRYRDSLIGG